MRGGLTKEGKLIAERKTGEENMMCPFSEAQCGTWCALLSEPIYQNNPKLGRREVVLNLCSGRYWKFTEFTDSRTSNNFKEEVFEGSCDLI